MTTPDDTTPDTATSPSPYGTPPVMQPKQKLRWPVPMLIVGPGRSGASVALRHGMRAAPLTLPAWLHSPEERSRPASAIVPADAPVRSP